MTYTLEQQKEGAELISTLAQKAWESSAFKEQLVKDPATAIRLVTGKNFVIPENQKLIVDDQTNPSIIYLNIPARPDFDTLELTEEQLELISGGSFHVCYAGAVVIGFVGCWILDKIF